MTTRYLLLSLCLVPLCLALGCSGYSEPPKEEVRAPAEKPRAGQLPQAPMPRAKKTTAELLVGTWRMMKSDGETLQPLVVLLTAEFTPDGRFTFWHVGLLDKRVETKRGSYTLKGQTITLTSEASADDPEKTWEVKIERLTETELITSKSEFVRILEKK